MMNALDTSVEYAPKAWYLIYTKARQEYIAQENLQRQGYQVFLPEVRETGRGRKASEKIIAPLFPRYFFIRLDRLFDQWGPIRSTTGVVKMVSFGNLTLPVPEELISGLQTKIAEHGWIELDEPGYVRGQAVRITTGAMQGCEAIFAASSGNDRVVVLLNIVGQQTRVTMPKIFIEAIA